MKLVAHGQNCIIAPVKQYEETWKGEVVLSPYSNKLKSGTVVFYGAGRLNHFNLPDGRLLHVVWEPQIYAVQTDAKVVQKIVDTLPDLKISQADLDKENARINHYD